MLEHSEIPSVVRNVLCVIFTTVIIVVSDVNGGWVVEELMKVKCEKC